jgi:uncharacterized protein with von Willebrand factor type A (vWA) domain
VSESALLHNVLLFGRVLRRAGLDVHHGRMIDAIKALDWIGVRARADVRATLRALLVHRHDDLARFDEVFDLFWSAHREPAPGLPLFSLGERARIVATRTPPAAMSVEFEDVSPHQAAVTRGVGAYSAAEVSRTKDFADFTPAELEQARLLLARLPWQLGRRRTRRWTRAAYGGIDLRPVLRRNLTRGGELVDLPQRRRRDRPRPLVLLGDVSGSMERYSRMLLHFVYGVTEGSSRVETFLFSTRLTRVTRNVRTHPVSHLARGVHDWGGGTRIGEALRTFNTQWARRVMRNGPVVIVISDGWDRGDPELLARELARVRRSCRRLIWLNPLLGSATYEPLTRGMQAALQHVDDFLPAHNLASLEQLAEHLRDLRPRHVVRRTT